MTFRFHLQHILEIREKEAKKAERAFELATRTFREIQTRIEEQKHLYFLERDELNQKTRSGKINEVDLFERSLNLRQERLIALLRKLRSAQEECDTQSKQLIQARKNLLALEKLKELKTIEYTKLKQKQEQNLLDEVGVQKFILSQKNLLLEDV